jgi:hypothetical protein
MSRCLECPGANVVFRSTDVAMGGVIGASSELSSIGARKLVAYGGDA